MKSYFVLIFTIAIFLMAQAQKPVFIAGGLSIFGGKDNNSKNTTFLPSLTVMPGFHILQKKDFALFVAAPISVGISYSKDNSHFYIGADLPVTINMNFGYGFTKNSTAKFGFLIGGGLGYHNSYNEIYNHSGVIEKDHLQFNGLLLHTGFAFRLDKNDSNGLLIRLSWLSQYPYHRQNVIGLGGIFIFGK